MNTQIALNHFKIGGSLIEYREVQVLKLGFLGGDFLTLYLNRLDHTLPPESLQTSSAIL